MAWHWNLDFFVIYDVAVLPLVAYSCRFCFLLLSKWKTDLSALIARYSNTQICSSLLLIQASHELLFHHTCEEGSLGLGLRSCGGRILLGWTNNGRASLLFHMVGWIRNGIILRRFDDDLTLS
jgi:hypothetical protein